MLKRVPRAWAMRAMRAMLVVVHAASPYLDAGVLLLNTAVPAGVVAAAVAAAAAADAAAAAAVARTRLAAVAEQTLHR